MLQSSRLEDHMKTIFIDCSRFNMSTFEHRCINNIKKLHQHTGKCDNQQNLKDILEDAPLYTTEGVTDNSPNVPMTSTTVKKPSDRKSLCLFTKYCMLNLKQKTSLCCCKIQTQSHENR